MAEKETNQGVEFVTLTGENHPRAGNVTAADSAGTQMNQAPASATVNGSDMDVPGTSGDDKVNDSGYQNSLINGSSSNSYQNNNSSATSSARTTAPQVPDLKQYLDQSLEAGKKQSDASIDYATNQSIKELTRAQEDAQEQFQAQRNQIDIDEAKAKDNQALYAEARGDKGGIGAAQYDSIMNNAMNNRLTVQKEQTKLSTDTARQIADLRAQGEYEKADAYLQLTQQYLQQLVQLEQWAYQANMDAYQFEEAVRQYENSYALQLKSMDIDKIQLEANLTGKYNGQNTFAAQQYYDGLEQTQKENAMAMYSSLIEQGDGDSMSAAAREAYKQYFGLSDSELNAQIATGKLNRQLELQATYNSLNKSSGSGSSGGGTKSGSGSDDDDEDTEPDVSGLFLAASKTSNPVSYMKQSSVYKRYGLNSAPSEDEYTAWSEKTNKGQLDEKSFEKNVLDKVKSYLHYNEDGDGYTLSDKLLHEYWPSLTNAQQSAIQQTYASYGKQYKYS